MNSTFVNIAALVAVALLLVVLGLVRRLRAVTRERAALAEETIALQRSRHADMAGRVANLETERGSPLHGLLTRRLGTIEAIAESIARDLERAEDAPPEARAAAIARSAVRAGQLARLAAGGRAREPHTTLAVVWPRVQALVAPRLDDQHTLRAAFAADLAPVAGSGEEWVQILTALIENAIAALPAGGIIEVGGAPAASGRARIWVADTGRGIRPEVLPHVMEPFYTSRAELGAEGLGLSMVAALVEGMAGHVTIASKVGEGTRVEMEVPVEAAPVEPALELTGTILLADDDKSVRAGLGRLLESFGADAVEADSGTTAKSLLLGEPARFRAAVLDVVMPGTPVGDVVAAMREVRPEFPVLLISGYDTMRMVDGVLALGGVRFLRKPFTREELHAALSDLVAPRPAGDAQP